MVPVRIYTPSNPGCPYFVHVSRSNTIQSALPQIQAHFASAYYLHPDDMFLAQMHWCDWIAFVCRQPLRSLFSNSRLLKYPVSLVLREFMGSDALMGCEALVDTVIEYMTYTPFGEFDSVKQYNRDMMGQTIEFLRQENLGEICIHVGIVAATFFHAFPDLGRTTVFKNAVDDDDVPEQRIEDICSFDDSRFLVYDRFCSTVGNTDVSKLRMLLEDNASANIMLYIGGHTIRFNKNVITTVGKLIRSRITEQDLICRLIAHFAENLWLFAITSDPTITAQQFTDQFVDFVKYWIKAGNICYLSALYALPSNMSCIRLLPVSVIHSARLFINVVYNPQPVSSKGPSVGDYVRSQLCQLRVWDSMLELTNPLPGKFYVNELVFDKIVRDEPRDLIHMLHYMNEHAVDFHKVYMPDNIFPILARPDKDFFNLLIDLDFKMWFSGVDVRIGRAEEYDDAQVGIILSGSMLDEVYVNSMFRDFNERGLAVDVQWKPNNPGTTYVDNNMYINEQILIHGVAETVYSPEAVLLAANNALYELTKNEVESWSQCFRIANFTYCPEQILELTRYIPFSDSSMGEWTFVGREIVTRKRARDSSCM